MSTVIQNLNCSHTISSAPSEQILEMDMDSGYLIVKTEAYKLTFIDLLNSRKKATLVMDEQDGISFFKPFYNGDQELLILTENGYVKLFCYKDLNIKEVKSSDNLELDGQVTAVSFNQEQMLLVVNQFVRVSKKNYKNALRVYKIKPDSWIWIEFLSEHCSNFYQSKHYSNFLLIFLDEMSHYNCVNIDMRWEDQPILIAIRVKGTYDFHSYVLNEDSSQIAELCSPKSMKTGTNQFLIFLFFKKFLLIF